MDDQRKPGRVLVCLADWEAAIDQEDIFWRVEATDTYSHVGVWMVRGRKPRWIYAIYHDAWPNITFDTIAMHDGTDPSPICGMWLVRGL